VWKEIPVLPNVRTVVTYETVVFIHVPKPFLTSAIFLHTIRVFVFPS